MSSSRRGRKRKRRRTSFERFELARSWSEEISAERDLSTFLIEACADDDRMANYFYW